LFCDQSTVAKTPLRYVNLAPAIKPAERSADKGRRGADNMHPTC
jgi:hypothetical protein